MFKFSRKTGPTEEEKLALAIAKSLSLQATAGGDGVATSSSNEGGEGVVVGSPTNTRMLATPKVEIRQDRVLSDDEDDDVAPSLPEGSMKVGNKTPDGTLITEELKSKWKRCIKEGRITDLEAKEMSYSDLIALLGPSRRVLLSRRQLEEIRDDATITGKIVILHDGFIWYLLHLIKKLRHRIWFDKRHIRELENHITNFEKEVCRLMTQIEGMEKIIHLLQEEVKTLKDENEKLNKAVEYLAAQVKENLAEIQNLNEKIRKLEREAQFWKDKAEEEKKNADKYKKLYHRCSKQLKETQHAFDQRRHEVIDILMKPLPGGCNFAEDEESEEGEKTVD